jgi:hypothetical protein
VTDAQNQHLLGGNTTAGAELRFVSGGVHLQIFLRIWANGPKARQSIASTVTETMNRKIVDGRRG